MTTIQESAPSRCPAPIYETEPTELLEMMERTPDRVFVMDIQDSGIFDGGHIPGARNVRFEDVKAASSELPKDRTVVIYCEDVSCGLPLCAALELAELGFCAKYLHGGLEAWSRKEFPVEASPPSPAPEY